VLKEKLRGRGAGDQGMMFGYACRETDNYMPLSLELSHMLLKELSAIRREGKFMKYLRPDAKSQVTVEYGDAGQPRRIHTLVVSTQHDNFAEDSVMLRSIESDIRSVLIPRVLAKLPPECRLF
jgi:S-adenosylmethionine synthetase